MPIDMSTVTAPPKKAAPRTGTRSTAKAPVTVEQTLAQKRQEGLMGLAQLSQAICVMVGQYADAATIGKYSPPLTQEVAELADTYDVIAAPIDMLIKMGPFGGLLAAGLPFALQILANHGRLDATRLSAQGVVPPAVLEAQMTAEVMRMQAEMLAAQKKAMAEAQQAKDELATMMSQAA